MKIKMLQSIAGHAEPRYRLADFGFAPGAVLEIHDELAKAWIAGKIALAAERSAKLTMPVEVYTLDADHPSVVAFLGAEEEAQAKAEKPQPEESAAEPVDAEQGDAEAPAVDEEKAEAE